MSSDGNRNNQHLILARSHIYVAWLYVRRVPQVACSGSVAAGYVVYVHSKSYLCLATDQRVAVKVKFHGETYQGTIICQPYSAICWVSRTLGNNAYGQVIVSVFVDCSKVHHTQYIVRSNQRCKIMTVICNQHYMTCTWSQWVLFRGKGFYKY